VKGVAALGFHASTYLHRSDPQCKPQQDLATFHSSYGNFTGPFASDQYNVNATTCSDVHNGMVNSVKNVVQHQLPTSGFPSSNSYVSSVSGGVVYDGCPHLATALAPSPAFNRSQFSANHSEMPTTAVEISKQPETNHSMPPLMMICDIGPSPAQTPAVIQTSAKQSASAIDVYEFHDDYVCKPAGVCVSYRQGMPSRSAAKNTLASPMYQSVDSQLACVHDLADEHRSEIDAAPMSAQQNVAVIFDMDSKSIRCLSLPVKTEPGLNESHPDSMPLKTIDSASPQVSWQTSHVPLQNNALHVAYGKHGMLNNDVEKKQDRFNGNTGSYPAFAHIGTNSSLRDIPHLNFTVRKMSEFDDRSVTFDRGHEKLGPLQPDNFTAEPESLSSAFRSVSCPAHKVPIKLEDVSTVGHMTNASRSEMVKCKTEPSSHFPPYQVKCKTEPSSQFPPYQVKYKSEPSSHFPPYQVKCKTEPSSDVPPYQFPEAPQSARSPHMWLSDTAAVDRYLKTVRASRPISLSGHPVYMAYSSSDYQRYDTPMQSSMPVISRPHSVSCLNHNNAVQLNHVKQMNVSFEGDKQYDTARENSHYNAMSHVRDFSQMTPSPSVVTGNQSFYPNLLPISAGNRNSASQIITDGHLPHIPLKHHSQGHLQQQQQQLGLSVKKEVDVDHNETMMTDDEEKLMNRLKCDLIEEAPHCDCRGWPCSVQ